MSENSPTPPQDSSLSPTQIKSILEAILFAANEPISIKQFTQVFGEVSTHDIREQLMALEDDYQAANRSFQLIEIANGFQVCSRPEYRDWIEKF